MNLLDIKQKIRDSGASKKKIRKKWTSLLQSCLSYDSYQKLNLYKVVLSAKLLNPNGHYIAFMIQASDRRALKIPIDNNII